MLGWVLVSCALVTDARWQARIDGDDDGFVNLALGGDDCDDEDAAVHPGAPERCDDADEDCDGATDDDATDAPPWFADLDGDGYGSDEAAIIACDAPEGRVADATDCFDGDAAVHPDAAEVCDGDDEDCDGVADDGAPGSPWFPDTDGDGYGDAAATATVSCGAPGADWVANSDDCDDTDREVAPGVWDGCNDGVDADCDGADDPCTVTQEVPVEDMAITLVPASGTRRFRGSAVAVADLDVDGHDDLLYGSAGASVDVGDVLYGPISAGDYGDEVDAALLGRSGDIGFGYALAVLDLDGDGNLDVASAAPAALTSGSPSGAVWIAWGDGARLADGESWLEDDVPATRLDSAVAGGRFGESLVAADLDADGVAELAISRSGDGSSRGEVVIVPGGVRFGSADVDDTSHGLVTGEDGGYFGYSSAAADVDGDGQAELVVGDFGAYSDYGAVYLMSDVSSSATVDADSGVVLHDGSVYGGCGYAVSGGDVDGDGYDELLVGCPYEAQGTVRLWLGGAATAWSAAAPDARFANLSGSRDLGDQAKILADVTGDGSPDVLGGITVAGADYLDTHVWLWSGRFSGTFDTDIADVHVFSSSGTFGALGVDVATGDLDGDGARDLALGASYKDGGVFVFLAE